MSIMCFKKERDKVKISNIFRIERTENTWDKAQKKVRFKKEILR